MAATIKSIFENLQQDTIWLRAKWKVFRQLFGTSEKRIAILNDFAPDFFQIVHDGLILACQPFRDIRNRSIAHSDLGTALDYHPNPLPGISPEMVENALKMFRNLLNEIHIHFDSNDTEYVDFELRGDGDSMIYYLKEAKAYHQHRIHGAVDPAADGVLSEE